MMRQNDRTTRRRIMLVGLGAAGGLMAVTAKAQEKIAQTLVQYQSTPKDGNKCSACVNFETPASCKIVAGKISPDGWCIAYAPKEQTNG